MSVVKKIAVGIGVVALLMATPVLAAKSKKAPKQPLPRPAPVFSWTGYYAGANAGGQMACHGSRSRGFLATPMLMIYGTGGLAFGQVKDTISVTGIPTAFTGVTIASSNDDIRVGFAGGGGAELMVSGSWSAKVEYLYCHLSDDTVLLNFNSLPNGAGTFVNYRFRNKGHILRLGLNYKIGQSTGP